MGRDNNTDVDGQIFSQMTIGAVWKKGMPAKKDALVGTCDASARYRDKYDRPIKRSEHGNTNSRYGWEIDHILPVAKGGSDDLSNLQPLQWENNRKKGDASPWNCS